MPVRKPVEAAPRFRYEYLEDPIVSNWVINGRDVRMYRSGTKCVFIYQGTVAYIDGGSFNRLIELIRDKTPEESEDILRMEFLMERVKKA
jgi:hypothetical protein